MPDFPIIDTHVHLTNKSCCNYPWMEEPESSVLNRDWTLSEFNAATGNVPIGKILFMEANCPPDLVVDEANWVTSLAAADARIQGIISKASIEKGARVTETLEIYKANPLVKAIRRLIQDEAEGFCLQPSFLEGLQLMPQFEFVFDICIHHSQLDDVIQMVQACPEVRFVLDHIGKPDIKGGVMEPWSKQIGTLASLENVACKISGMVTEADHDRWTRDDLCPYIDHVVEAFGFDRVLFGGDWFVQTLASTYPRWVDVLDWVLSGCSEDELKRFYVTNAEVIYGV